MKELEWVEPLSVFRGARDRAGLVWLDSGGEAAPPARWSVIGIAPREVLELRVGTGAREPGAPEPFAALEELHLRWRDRLAQGRGEGASARIDAVADLRGSSTAPMVERAASVAAKDPRRAMPTQDPGLPMSPAASAVRAVDPRQAEAPPFTGGVLALVGYDVGRSLERLPSIAADDPALPDLWAGVYDSVLVFDRADERLWLTSWTGDGGAAAALGALARGAREDAPSAGVTPGDRPTPMLPGAVDVPSGSARPSAHGDVAVRGNGDDPSRADAFAASGRDGFLAGVARIRDEIARGEIYQANLTRRIVRPARLDDAPALYEHLRAGSPTPFAAYVDAGYFRLLSASPERLLRVADGVVETRPIKGTRPRGATPREDIALRDELLASAKDAAELLMIVDLERNDLGRVAATGSVEVRDFPRIEGYSTVWHLVATVRARLRPGVSAADALRAAFPGGSITGAPKVRAMEILETIEPARRKFSMGSLVAWDFGGRMDASILIRTITVRAGEAVLDVGGGIVADSSPQAEYEETLAKAAPLIAALEGV